MNFQILSYRGTIEEDREITSLLNHVYVKDGYTDKSYAEKIFVPAELRKRGEIILARSIAGKLLGMAIFVPSTSPARQVAELGEAEIHLLAVYPEAGCQGIASRLIKACEEQAVIWILQNGSFNSTNDERSSTYLRATRLQTKFHTRLVKG